MKKYLLLILCTITLGLSSCEKEVLVPNSSNRTILVDIFPNDWRTDDNGFTYYKVINVPENTANFNDIGHIAVSMSFEDVDVYEGLPQVYGNVSYRFTTEPGYVTIHLNNPAGNSIRVTQPTFESTAKITLIDSQLIN